MKRIVVGFDSTEQAADALRLAAVLCSTTGSELIVVSVDEFEPILGDGAELREHREAYFAANFERAGKVLGGREFTERTSAGSVPGALDQIAHAEDADAIVVGSTHRGAVGRVLPGSVGDRLLAGAPCAVAIAPLGYAARGQLGIERVGVAYDGEAESRSALRAGLELARERGAELALIGVAPTLADELVPGRIGHTKGGYAKVLRRHFEQLLSAELAEIPGDVAAEARVLDGDPARQIAAQGADLDLLILGSRGYGPLRRTVLGGVARDVVKMAACPVLILPRSAGEAG
jgi:nucleotide-binding universal stress UspA family protein